eukprot:m.172899 g.172899  ORF g.172899 m.172899 type:complete len:250 (-) comp31705_c2_seq1:103-852(-)
MSTSPAAGDVDPTLPPAPPLEANDAIDEDEAEKDDTRTDGANMPSPAQEAVVKRHVKNVGKQKVTQRQPQESIHDDDEADSRKRKKTSGGPEDEGSDTEPQVLDQEGASKPGYGVVLQIGEAEYALFEECVGASHLEVLGWNKRHLKRQPLKLLLKWLMNELEVQTQIVLSLPTLRLEFASGTTLTNTISLEELHLIHQGECNSGTLKIFVQMFEDENAARLDELKEMYSKDTGASVDDPILIDESDSE